MSTRGTFGFVIDNKSYLFFNHYDSYPSNLGYDILEFIRIVKDWELLKNNILKINFIEDFDNFDNFDRVLFLKNLISGKIKEVSLDNSFIKDSLYCEFGYIINLDIMKLEFYIGFQKKPQYGNRYGTEIQHHIYYPCRLVGVFDLNEDGNKIAVKMDKILQTEQDDVSVNKYLRKLKIINMDKLYNKKNAPTYSFESYEGHNNEEIISLINDLNDCKAEQRRIEKEIELIQDNCEHEYLFVCKGAYEDAYTCKKCGHDNWM